MRPDGNSITVSSGVSISPNRLVWNRTPRKVSAQEVHQRALHDVRARLERRLVGGLLGAEVDHRLGDVDVLGVGELLARGLLELPEPRLRGVEAVGARAVEGADAEEVVEVLVEPAQVAV